jgi:hypothetical protein
MLSRGGLPEAPCARCGRRVVGLGWGELCPQCRAERSRRASRIATRISLAAALLMGLYVAFRMPPDPMARIYGAVAVLATYIIVRRIASRVAMETMK